MLTVVRHWRSVLLTFVELRPFTTAWARLATDTELAKLQRLLLTSPDAGDLIPGARGLRKVRVGARGRGKRGGVRVIYAWWPTEATIYLVFAYEKHRTENLSTLQLRALRRLLDGEEE